MLNTKSKKFLSYHKDKIPISKFSESIFFYKNFDLIEDNFPCQDPYLTKEFRIFQEISYKCTGQCPYCMNKGLDLNEKEVPVEDYITFYQKIIDNGGSIRLKITGGEPLQPNVIERTKQLVDYALKNDKHFSLVWINSNGNWPIPEEWANKEKIIIQFSLDGDKEYIEKTTKISNLYEHLIKNFDFCKENNIKFRIRSVISKENEKFIPFLKQISKKYKVLVNLNWALPVGGAKDNYSNDEYIEIINKAYNFKMENGDNPLIDSRLIIGKCPKIASTDYFRLMITPSGKLGLCPLTATFFKFKDINTEEELSIYNFDFTKLYALKDKIIDDMQDKSCGFPNGFLNFWNSLTIEQKNKLHNYINFISDPPLPSLKEIYNLKEGE